MMKRREDKEAAQKEDADPMLQYHISESIVEGFLTSFLNKEIVIALGPGSQEPVFRGAVGLKEPIANALVRCQIDDKGYIKSINGDHLPASLLDETINNRRKQLLLEMELAKIKINPI